MSLKRETALTELTKRLKLVCLDEMDQKVMKLFISDEEIPYWEHSDDLRVQQEFKITVANVWVMICQSKLPGDVAEKIAFECGKSVLPIESNDIRIICKMYEMEQNMNLIRTGLQNKRYLRDTYKVDELIIEKFLLKLLALDAFKTTRLDKHCMDWDREKFMRLGSYLSRNSCKHAVQYMIRLDQQSKEFISAQMNARSNTLLLDQIRGGSRIREDFIASNSWDDALCFEDIFYVLKRLNGATKVHIADIALSKEEVLHGHEAQTQQCDRILRQIQDSKPEVQHTYILKNDVKEGMMGHWTVLCYERSNGRWRLCDYYNPSGQGFRCGDRCIKWILVHALNHSYITDFPPEIFQKLFEADTEREITWDLTEYFHQMEEYVVVDQPTYKMHDETGNIVNLVPISANEDSMDLCESDSESDSLTEDMDWENVPTVEEALCRSFTQEEIEYLIQKHGIPPEIPLNEAVQLILLNNSEA